MTADDPVLRVRLEAATLAELRSFTDEVDADLGCRAIATRSASGYAIDVHLPESRLESARGSRAATPVSMTVVENATATGLERQAEVAEGNRYAARGEVPRGLGSKE
ncbi:MAG TPA: hypothetical protein VNP92_28855 [Actinophytocola sp.]|nr:hypothetical protein [Actinophytocola sp.]